MEKTQQDLAKEMRRFDVLTDRRAAHRQESHQPTAPDIPHVSTFGWAAIKWCYEQKNIDAGLRELESQRREFESLQLTYLLRKDKLVHERLQLLQRDVSRLTPGP
ncbi:hypothetical protein VTK73DRAFT_4562 [Phialemonium thermophilum]|uniref:Uncharacterized protein n=1 Tax=Phialemonium thermophilum TaxID=223376 RepID=A0ABR3WTL9_9PEZI